MKVYKVNNELFFYSFWDREQIQKNIYIQSKKINFVRSIQEVLSACLFHQYYSLRLVRPEILLDQ